MKYNEKNGKVWKELDEIQFFFFHSSFDKEKDFRTLLVYDPDSELKLSSNIDNIQARSKLPKKRRCVLPVEQIRRKQQQQLRGEGLQRRMNAFKQHSPGMYQEPIAAVAVVAAAAGSSKPGNSIAADTFHLSIVQTASAGANRISCPLPISSSFSLIAFLSIIDTFHGYV